MGFFDKIFNREAKVTELFMKGNAFVNSGNYKEAIKTYSEAIEINPKYEDSWVNQGIAYQKLRQHQKAIASFEEALRINPKSQNTLYNLGVSNGELDQNEEAVKWYNQVLSLYPDDKDAIFNKNVCLGKLKKLDTGLKTDPAFTQRIYITLIKEGLVLSRTDYSASNKKFSEALKLNPSESFLWYQIGLNYFSHNEHTKAIEAFDKAISLRPFSEVYHLKSICLKNIGDEKSAKECNELSRDVPFFKDIGAREILDLC